MDPSTTCLPLGAGQHNFQIKKISNTHQETFLGHLKKPSNAHQEPFPTQVKTFMKISTDTSNSKSGWAVSCYQKDITFGLCLRCIACFSKFSDLYLGWFHVKHEQVPCIWDDYKLTRQILILVWRPEVRSFKWSVSQRNIEKMRLVLRCPTENMIDLNV